MNIHDLQQKIDLFHYWDSWVKRLFCDHFADEVTLVYEDSPSGDVVYKFLGCYKATFEHGLGYEKEKPVKELSRGQLPYFLHDVEVGEIEVENFRLYTCKIVMPPMNIEIWCRDIQVDRAQ